MRKITIVAVLIMLAAAAFGTGAQDGAGTDKGYTLTKPGAFPVVEGAAEITIMVGRDDGVTEDMDTNAFTELYEEKSGVHINWIQASIGGGQAQEKANIALASGDYPEAFMAVGINKIQLSVYGGQGIFVPLNDSIESQSVYLKKTNQENPYLLGDLTAPDGNIYGFPRASECYHCTANQRFYIYKPWMEKLGLDMPETTEELYQVLRAFKTQDPNGNGKADEIPFAATPERSYPFFMNAFIYTDGSPLSIDNKTIDTPVNKAEWREGLRYIKRLYDEGLIAPESFTMSGAQLKQLGENPDIPILGSAEVYWFGSFTINNGPSRRFVEYVGLAPVEGPAGVRFAATYPYKSKPQLVVTDKAADVDLITRWVDWMYTKEGTLTAWWGEEGVGWRKPKSGEMGIAGGLASWVTILDFGLHNLYWGNTPPGYFNLDVRENRYTDFEPIEEFAGYMNFHNVKNNYEPYKKKEVIPALYFTEDQARELAEIESILKDHITESTIKFITGVLDIESDWGSYTKELSQIGMPKYLEINQTAYDAVYK